MERIKIDFPEKIHFITNIKVRISDINYGNHVGNDSVVSILHEARVQFLHSLFYTELNIGGVGLIVADLQVEYKKQQYYNELLTIYIAVDAITKKSFQLLYKIENEQKETTVLAKTGMLCYDYTAQKIASLPIEFIEKFN
jgi:acyl-CoA thioester hydrolase